jgi:hypothetical protein
MKRILFTLALTIAVQFSYAQWTTGTGDINNTNNGNVGVGTSTPVRKFTVSNNGNEGLEIGPGNLVGDASNAVTSVYYNRNIGSFINNVQAALSHSFAISGVGTSMIINSSGNVGVGTTNPPTNGNYGVLALNGRSPSQGGYLSLMNNGSEIGSIVANSQFNFQTAPGFVTQFYTGSTPTFQISANSNIGIGTITPSRKLDVLSGSGVTPFAAVGPNGYILIDNTGAGYNYYSASVLHEFQIGGIAQMDITSNGNVLIGKTTQNNTAYKLDVKGKTRADEIVVNTTGADFVFDKKYTLPKLSDVKTFIDANQHLPEIPSAKEMQTNGMSIGEINTKLLQKVEELTLYLIDKDKQLSDQQKVNQSQQKQIDQLKRQLTQITKTLNKK